MSVAVTIMAERYERAVLDYFRQNKAIQPNKAIEPNLDDMATSISAKANEINLHNYPFIKRVDETHTYWLDEQAYKKASKLKVSIMLLLGLGILVIIVYLLFSLSELLH